MAMKHHSFINYSRGCCFVRIAASTHFNSRRSPLKSSGSKLCVTLLIFLGKSLFTLNLNSISATGNTSLVVSSTSSPYLVVALPRLDGWPRDWCFSRPCVFDSTRGETHGARLEYGRCSRTLSRQLHAALLTVTWTSIVSRALSLSLFLTLPSSCHRCRISRISRNIDLLRGTLIVTWVDPALYPRCTLLYYCSAP